MDQVQALDSHTDDVEDPRPLKTSFDTIGMPNEQARQMFHGY